MTREMKHLVLITGMVCVVLGLGQFVLGSQLAPGAAMANATMESAERFAGGILIGFGLAWLWAARMSPIPLVVVRFLAGVSAARRDRSDHLHCRAGLAPLVSAGPDRRRDRGAGARPDPYQGRRQASESSIRNPAEHRFAR
jgi:hypothetical protein